MGPQRSRQAVSDQQTVGLEGGVEMPHSGEIMIPGAWSRNERRGRDQGGNARTPTQALVSPLPTAGDSLGFRTLLVPS